MYLGIPIEGESNSRPNSRDMKSAEESEKSTHSVEEREEARRKRREGGGGER